MDNDILKDFNIKMPEKFDIKEFIKKWKQLEEEEAEEKKKESAKLPPEPKRSREH